MTELDRVGSSDNVNFRGWGVGVHRFCKSARNAHRQREIKMACLHSWFCYISIANVWVLDNKYVL